MPQYLVAVYHPDDYDPSVETEATIEAIHALNRELIAAGARKFACGLSPAGNAKSLRAQPDGKVLVTDGPYTETKEHIGGFWILEAADMDEALAWARKGAVACRASGEVREILFRPAPTQEPGAAKSRTKAGRQRLRNLRIGYCWIPAWGAFDGGSRRHTQPTPFFQARFFAACRHAHGVRSPGGGLKSRKQADCRKGALNWSPGRLPPASPG